MNGLGDVWCGDAPPGRLYHDDMENVMPVGFWVFLFIVLVAGGIALWAWYWQKGVGETPRRGVSTVERVVIFEEGFKNNDRKWAVGEAADYKTSLDHPHGRYIVDRHKESGGWSHWQRAYLAQPFLFGFWQRRVR